MPRQPFIGPRLRNGRTRTNVKKTTTTIQSKGSARKKANYSDNQILRVKQVLPTSFISNFEVAASGSMYGYKYTLSQVEQNPTFTALFDQYRIDKVVVKFIPRGAAQINANQDDAVLNTVPMYWYSAIDKDDANSINVQAIREHGNCRTHIFNGKTVTISFRPHVAIAGFGGAFTQYMNSKSMWIDCASATAEHYGLKVTLPGSGNVSLNNTVGYDVVPTLYLSFKHIR